MRLVQGLHKLFIIAFWAVLFILFLFIPSFLQKFQTQKSITVFTWPLIIDPKTVAAFEKETGIKVYLNYFETNQELLAKMKGTGGKGLDLIVPSDHAVELLIRDGLIKKIDKTKLPFLKDIIPQLQGLYCDPNNDYSIPYIWAIYGLGINPELMEIPKDPSWALVFDKNKTPGTISMTNDGREAILMAAFYLFGDINSLKEPSAEKEVKELLLAQKEWVQVYTDMRAEELLASKSVPLAVVVSPDLWKIKTEYEHLEFVLPKEGTFALIDMFAIPKASKKEDLVYQFLNYLYQPKIIEYHMQEFGFCSPISTVSLQLPKPFCPTIEEFRRFEFFKNVVPEDQLNKIWISVMAG